MRSFIRFCVIPGSSVIALLAPVPAYAQDERSHLVASQAYSVDEAYLTGLEWRNIGPRRGGRSIAAAGSSKRPNEYYFGAIGGGLWKTTDGGTTWKPITDGKIDTGTVGGVAVCEANPDVIYLTTGETELRGNIMPGSGVFKSVDAGKTWKFMGLKDVQNFSRVRIDPTNCDSVLVGGFGHYGAPNPDRGIYKSSDGGSTWRKSLYRDPRSGAVDISIDPHNPKIVFAALWEAWRKPWGLSSGGPGSGLFKSTDGGETWSELTHKPGMPGGLIGKIGVSVSPVDGNRVYAIVENRDGGVFVSDDGGETWRRSNDSRDLRQRAFYYSRIVADPVAKDRVYVLNVQFWRSDDGGKTFPKKIKVPHGDNHDLWIAANNNQRMIQANDGGANVSVNGGETWTRQEYPTAQIYRVTISKDFPYFVCGAQQDNSSICVPSKGWRHLNALGQYGFSPAGGESGYVANDPLNPNIYYAGSYGGLLERFDRTSGQTRAVNILPDNPMGYSAGDLAERFQWTFPIVFDPQDKKALYATSQHVWRTTNEGQSWERISPDLTRHDPATLTASGGPITLDQTGVETFATVFALAPSRLEPDVIWAGSDDGLVHITRDNGRTWQNVTPAGLPDYLKITTIEDSPHQPGTAYLTGNRFLLDDMRPYILKTSDYGRTWTSIAKGIPSDEVARSIREDPSRPGLLFLGTERGVWASFDDGLSWQKLQRNLPATQVADLAVTDHDLVIGTHGRSFWVLDNIDVLRQLDRKGSRPSAVRLFRPAPAVRGIDEGVTIDYFLPQPTKRLTIEILDGTGKVIRTFTGAPEKKKDEEAARKDDDGRGAPPKPTIKAGLNRFTWDMRYPGFTEFSGMILWAADNDGPLAVPGTYRARMIADGRTQEQPITISLDPHVNGVTQADLQRRFELSSRIRDAVSRANELVLLIRGVRTQIADRLKRTNDPAVLQSAKQLDSDLAGIEGQIYQVRNQSDQDPLNFPIQLNNKLAALAGVVESAEAAPTDQATSAFARFSSELDVKTSATNRLLEGRLSQLNDRLRRIRLQPVEKRSEAAVEQGTAAVKARSERSGNEEDEEARRW